MTGGYLSNYRRQLAEANRENQGLQKKLAKLSKDVAQLKSQTATGLQGELVALTSRFDALSQTRSEQVDRVAELEAAVAERDEGLAQAGSQASELEALLENAVASLPTRAVVGGDAESESERDAQTRELLATVIPLVRKNSKRIANSIEEPLEALYSLWHPAEDNGEETNREL